jgi:holliday junction DNA helicase RuvB
MSKDSFKTLKGLKKGFGMAASEAFKDIIGQETVLTELDFYIESYKKSRHIPHICLIAPKGCGKTTIGKATASALRSLNSEKRGLYISCAGYQKATVDQFYTQVVAQIMDSEATIFFDECHNLSSQIQEELLGILNPNPNNLNVSTFDSREWVFDFRKLSFIFATTEPHMMKEALVDRLSVIQLEEYRPDQLAEIVKLNLSGYKLTQQTLNTIASTTRGNARDVQKVCQKILIYLDGSGKKTFNLDDWSKLCKRTNIKPLGLKNAEINILRVLSQVSEMRLTQLSNVTGINRNALQKDLETYIAKRNLIQIKPSGRKITEDGIKYLDQLEQMEKPVAKKKVTRKRKAAK